MSDAQMTEKTGTDGGDAIGTSDTSLLEGGQATAGTDQTSWLTAHPQFAVNGADGKPDIAASAAKLATSYKEMSTKMRDVGMPPKEVKDYTITVPEALKDKYDPKGDKLMDGFVTKAHAAGLTQKQLDVVLGEYFGIAQQMAGATRAVNREDGEKVLRETWKTDTEFKAGLGNAYKTMQAFGGDRKAALVDKFGNDPDFNWLLAQIGKELQEDTVPTVDGIPGSSYATMDRTALMQHDAYKDPLHPDHARVSKFVKALFEKEYGTATAV